MSDADELIDASAPGRWARRPVLVAISFIAIAALALGGLYQGYRFTFRNEGPAPHYVWLSTQPSPAVATPELAAADPEPRPHARQKVDLADNDDAQPSQADGPKSSPAAVAPIAPIDRAALIPASTPAQQGVIFDQPAAAVQAPEQPQP